jgi:hypothetical protein
VQYGTVVVVVVVRVGGVTIATWGGSVVVVGGAVVVVGDAVVVVAGTVVVVVVVLVVVAAILAELLAALDDGWLLHAAVVNANAVTAHTVRANRRGRGNMPRGTWVRIAAPSPRKKLLSL